MNQFWQTRWKVSWGVALWCCLALALLIAAASRFSQGLPLQTNLLALLPATERNPVAEEAVTRLVNAAGDRAVFLVGHADFASAVKAARQMGKALQGSGAFASVNVDVPTLDIRKVTDFYAPYQYRLLSDADREFLKSSAPDFAARVQAKLYAPFSLGLRLPLAQDPLAMTDGWLASLPLSNLKLLPEDGVLVHHEKDSHWVLLSAALPGSAYDKPVQTAALTAISLAEADLPNGVSVLRTGTLFYAAAARTQAEREVDWIGAVSVLGMLILLYRVFRSVRPLLLGLLSVGLGILAAILGVVVVHGELHLITLVFGASLIGEAIDYAVQYFAAHMGAGSQWQPLPGLRRIAPGLCMALLTSLLGYGVLILSPFSALQQIALFAICGLLTAWLSVFLLLPAFLNKPSRRDPEQAVALPRRFLAAWEQHLSPRRATVLVLALTVVAIAGCLQLRSDDDIRLLISRPPGLLGQEQQIRELTGFANNSRFLLIEGATPEAVLQTEEKLALQLHSQDWVGVSRFVPSLKRQQAHHALLHEKLFARPQQLEKLLVDMQPSVAAQQRKQFAEAETRQLKIEDWLATPLSTPFRHLWLGATAQGYASIALPSAASDVEELGALASRLPGVTFVDKAGSVSELFRSFRESGVRWLAGALMLVLCVLKFRYSWGVALRVLLPTLLAMGLTLAACGVMGKALTLFNVMGLMLVLGIGVNYAIFLREGGSNAAATLAGVALSAGTTLLSFGLLAFSSMPALSGFGLTLLLGIGIAVLLSPLSMDRKVSA